MLMEYDFGIRAIHYDQPRIEVPAGFLFTPQIARQVRIFHQSFPDYHPTPLVSLKKLARLLGVDTVYIKDESCRFGLNAFKVLGGSYAIGRYIAERLQIPFEDMTFSRLTKDKTRRALGDVTFVTATDGNHGRGVAWTARQLDQRCVVYMPKGSAPERLENIRALGAEAYITQWNYDDTVRFAAQYAAEHEGVLVQDTDSEGYEEIPVHIMQGYMTMMEEAVEQLKGKAPTHVFLQAGVGAMAGSMAGYLAARFGEKRPRVVIVEPDQADCFFRTAQASDGQLHAVTGSLATMMAGLACGEPCLAAWKVLGRYADHFISMPDLVAAEGMRVLGAPLPGDERIISGESGAAGFGLAFAALWHPELAGLKAALGLSEHSRILCISTEGATDRSNYQHVVWD